MTWRTVVISSNSKLDLKLGYLVIRNADIRKVHLSEISVLMIESTAVSLTSMLLCELCRRNIKVIFCDEAHNPVSEMMPLHGCHNSPGKLRSQIEWDDETQRFYAMHHPFTSPKAEDIPLLDTDTGAVRANAYDMVINGGSIMRGRDCYAGMPDPSSSTIRRTAKDMPQRCTSIHCSVMTSPEGTIAL